MRAAGGTGRAGGVLLGAALAWLALLAVPIIRLILHPPPAAALVPAVTAAVVLVGGYVLAAVRTAQIGEPQRAPLAAVLVATIAVLLPFAAGPVWYGGTIFLAALLGVTLRTRAALVGIALATVLAAVLAVLLNASAATASAVCLLTALAGVMLVAAVMAVRLAAAEAELARLREDVAVEEPEQDTDLRGWVTRWADKNGITVEMSIDDLDEQCARALFPVAIEALTNVVRHASAQTVAVMVHSGRDMVTVTIADDGTGFDPALTPPRRGLRGVTEQLLAAGGVLTVHSAPGEGTAITAELPRG